MIRIFTCICVAAFLLSYCSPKKSITDTLIADCFWDILDIGSPHPINTCYKFSKTGDYSCYYYNYYAKKRLNTVYIYDEADIIDSNKWEVLKDSIQISAIKYSIIRYTPDSVFLMNRSRDTMVLIKNCQTVLELMR
jgi:hypothetical protein